MILFLAKRLWLQELQMMISEAKSLFSVLWYRIRNTTRLMCQFLNLQASQHHVTLPILLCLSQTDATFCGEIEFFGIFKL